MRSDDQTNSPLASITRRSSWRLTQVSDLSSRRSVRSPVSTSIRQSRNDFWSRARIWTRIDRGESQVDAGEVEVVVRTPRSSQRVSPPELATTPSRTFAFGAPAKG